MGSADETEEQEDGGEEGRPENGADHFGLGRELWVGQVGGGPTAQRTLVEVPREASKGSCSLGAQPSLGGRRAAVDVSKSTQRGNNTAETMVKHTK